MFAGQPHDDHSQGTTSRSGCGNPWCRYAAADGWGNIATVGDAWTKHLVVVFPDQHITDQEHVAFTRHFGEPEIFTRRPSPPLGQGEGDFPRFELRRAGSPDAALGAVAEATVLGTPVAHRFELPANAQCRFIAPWHRGQPDRRHDAFINMYMVYDDLPESLRRQVEGRKARHDFSFLNARGLAAADARRAGRDAAGLASDGAAPSRHRTESLYISSIYNDAVEGMDDSAGHRLIEELSTFIAQPKYMYRHVWEPDEVLMWDNRCTVHAVTPHDPGERRVMHRTTIVGSEPVMAG